MSSACKARVLDLYQAIDATWPSAQSRVLGPVCLREGQGGGSRVSAATVSDRFSAKDLELAEEEMRQMGQRPLFMIRDGENALDQALEARGYAIKDPVLLRSCSANNLACAEIPPLTTFDVWPPLAVQNEIWQEGGIDLARHAIMQRCVVAKTAIFGRVNDQPAATAFVAIHDGIALLHALEVRETQRRKGLGKWIMHHAANWALRNGATDLAVLVTVANAGANALYQQLGMGIVGRYHYREMKESV